MDDKKTPMNPIGRDTVVQKIVGRVTQAINSGRFGMGDKLPSEFELMDELHVSRNSLREAMKILSALGIVEIKRGDGTYICSQLKPSLFDSIIYDLLLVSSTNEEIVELRQTMDEAILDLAIQKRTETDIKNLNEYIRKMKLYFDSGEISKAAATDYEFHLYLIDCCGNAFLSRIVKGIYSLFAQSFERNIRTEEQFARAVEHHQGILDCLISRDAGKVKETIAASLSSWRKNVKGKLTQ
jgi:GntR family transcriptional regulator, transcriptional repressor for pyruvate dehydrogenase complex